MINNALFFFNDCFIKGQFNGILDSMVSSCCDLTHNTISWCAVFFFLLGDLDNVF